MQAVDKEVIGQILNWLNAGSRCWLATVVETWGSSPRPVGSLLACNDTGIMVGSLSGGCVEEDLQEKLLAGELAAEQAGHGLHQLWTALRRELHQEDRQRLQQLEDEENGARPLQHDSDCGHLPA